MNAYRLRADRGYMRLRVLERDHGRCAACGLEGLKLELAVADARYRATLAWCDEHGLEVNDAPEELARLVPLAALKDAIQACLRPYGLDRHWKRRSFWDVDHIVPVREGGLAGGLANLRTLCCACHAARNAADNQTGRGPQP